MQYILDIRQIEQRSEAIGIKLKRLARMAGVDPATAYRAAKGQTDPRMRTMRALLEALERQEGRMLAHLKDIARSGGGRQIDIFDVRFDGKATHQQNGKDAA